MGKETANICGNKQKKHTQSKIQKKKEKPFNATCEKREEKSQMELKSRG